MKRLFKLLSVAVIVTACNNENKTKETSKDTTQITRDSTRSSAIQQTSCYQFNLQRDTVRLKLCLSGHRVTDILDYDMYEKDDRHGTIEGTLNGEIIKADYTYEAEGTTSVQEILFKFKGDTITEGTGEMEERDNKFIFKDSSKVEFKQKFEKVACK